MTSLAILLAISLLSSSLATTAKDVTFAPEPYDWAIMSNASGTVTTSAETVVVTLDTHTIMASTKYSNTRKVSEFVACLAYRSSETDWGTATCSKPVKHKAKLEPGQSETIKDMTFVIPTDGLPPIENFWLVLKVFQAPIRGEVSHTVSHSQRDIFKQPATQALDVVR